MTWTAEQKDMRALLNTADSLLWSCCPKCKSIVEKNVSQGNLMENDCAHSY
jgi:hypothetical protein